MIIVLTIIFIGVLWAIMWVSVDRYQTHQQPYVADHEEPKEEIEKPKALTAKLTESYLTLDNYVGQRKVIDYLKGHIKRAKRTNAPLPHTVLWGSGGLGKSTLMKAAAHEMGGRFIEVVPANLRSINDLFGLFFAKKCGNCGNLSHFSSKKCLICKGELVVNYYPEILMDKFDVLFFEEVHGLKADIEEALYSLMQEGYIMLRYQGIDQPVEFPPITIGGATTLLGSLSKPFRDRFKLDLHLEPYSDTEICQIVGTYCAHKNIIITKTATEQIAKFSYGTPRLAKRLVDDAITRGDIISKTEIDDISFLKDLDENGLTKIHRDILKYVHIRNFAGATAIANSVGVHPNAYIELYEPGLLHKELIMQGSRGRTLTLKARNVYFRDCVCKFCKEIH